MPVECRICLKMKREVSSLFDKDRDKRIYAEKISEFASIQISKNDGLTDVICGVCVRTLRSVLEFRQLCRDSDETLRKRMGLTSSVEFVEEEYLDMDDLEKDNNFFATTADISEIVTIKEEQLENGDSDHFEDSLPNEYDIEQVNEVPETDPNAIALKRMNPDLTIVKIEAQAVRKQPTRKPRRRKNLDLDETSPRKIYHRRKKSEFTETAIKVKVEKNVSSTPTYVEEPIILPRKVLRTVPKMKAEKRRFFCEVCGKCFESRTILESHLLRHQGIKPHECSDCGKSFVLKSELRRHSFVHSGLRPYPCRFCGRAFADYSSKIKHERCHLNERQYKCDLCDMGFNYSYALKKHKLVHSGAKNFYCTLCKLTFRSKCNLNNHIKGRHKDLDDIQRGRLLKMGDLLAVIAEGGNDTNTYDQFSIKVVTDEGDIPQVHVDIQN